MRGSQRWLTGLIGLGAVGSALVGILSTLTGLVAVLNANLQAAGACFIAAALAFGLLLLATIPR